MKPPETPRDLSMTAEDRAKLDALVETEGALIPDRPASRPKASFYAQVVAAVREDGGDIIELPKNLEAHPAANIFPMMNEADLQSLARDILDNGLAEPIVLYEDKILDGRNRRRACEMVRVSPAFERWQPHEGESPVKYVLSKNLHRRHLDESQRAMIGARVEPMLAEEAKKRQSAAGGAHPGPLPANLPEASKGEARAQAAAQVNVSPRSVSDAKAVLKSGDEELIAACDAGFPVSAAAQLAKEPEEKRRRVVRAVRSGKAKNAAEAMRTERLSERHARNRVTVSVNAAVPFPERRWSVIAADPPWQYEHAISTSREIEEQYPTLDIDDICALKIGERTVEECATDDAVLFLWVPPSLIEQGLQVMEAWGFSYRTLMVWNKEKVGMGFWVRQQIELLLVGIHGNPPTPEAPNRPASLFSSPRGKHSDKPDIAYQIIERMYEGAARLELFARGGGREGWNVWGNEAEV